VRLAVKTALVGVVLTAGLAACSNASAPAETSLQQFQTHLQSLCGQSYLGRVTSTDPQDDDWRKEMLTLGPVTCPDTLTTVLPLAVGADKSRVWTLTLQDAGQALDFRHAHTLKDGSPDPVTGYGGVATTSNSSALRAVFPVDDYSKNNFKENGLEASMTNIWSIDINPGKTMTYSLNREGRNFVAAFDLTSAK